MIIVQIDYVTTLQKDNYIIQKKKILCKRLASLLLAVSHIGI